jgi:hypothetical protein
LFATLSEVERARLERHAQECAACRGTRARVTGTQQAMRELRDEPPPPLAWDRLGARVHWLVSSEVRLRERAGQEHGLARRLRSRARPIAVWAAIAAAVAVCGAIGVKVLRSPDGVPSQPTDPVQATNALEDVPPLETPARPPRAPAAGRLGGVVTLGGGAPPGGGGAATMDAAFVPGMRLATEEGRLAVQFGDKSGFLLEANSTVLLQSFDDRRVELAIERGAISVELTRRGPEQRFSVVAGERRVEVRGTVFRVERTRDGIDVTCPRGRVAVAGRDARDPRRRAPGAPRRDAHLGGARAPDERSRGSQDGRAHARAAPGRLDLRPGGARRLVDPARARRPRRRRDRRGADGVGPRRAATSSRRAACRAGSRPMRAARSRRRSSGGRVRRSAPSR